MGTLLSAGRTAQGFVTLDAPVCWPFISPLQARWSGKPLCQKERSRGVGRSTLPGFSVSVSHTLEKHQQKSV